MNVHSKVFPSYPLLTSWCPNSINNCISAPGNQVPVSLARETLFIKWPLFSLFWPCININDNTPEAETGEEKQWS